MRPPLLKDVYGHGWYQRRQPLTKLLEQAESLLDRAKLHHETRQLSEAYLLYKRFLHLVRDRRGGSGGEGEDSGGGGVVALGLPTFSHSSLRYRKSFRSTQARRIHTTGSRRSACTWDGGV